MSMYNFIENGQKVVSNKSNGDNASDLDRVIRRMHCAFRRDALDRRRCNTRDRHRVLLTTPLRRRTDIVPLDISPSDISLTLACDGIRQEVQVLNESESTN